MVAKVDEGEFEQLVTPLRAELHAHCYRMLGSLADADDALQEALLGAWRGFSGFEPCGVSVRQNARPVRGRAAVARQAQTEAGPAGPLQLEQTLGYDPK